MLLPLDVWREILKYAEIESITRMTRINKTNPKTNIGIGYKH